jgi:hypothetical protein
VELNWDSAQLALHVFKILAEERLGYHVAVTAPDYSRVSTALHVVAGCPSQDFCSSDIGSLGSPDAPQPGHLVFEVWPNGEEPLGRYQAEFPERAPERLGDIGYSGREGTFLRPQIFAEALTARGAHLTHYGSYNSSWFQPSEYFDNFTDLDLGRFRTCADALQNTTLHAALSDYHRHFGSDTSVYVQDGALELACESDRWWLSPSCRETPHKCIPYIDFHGWGSKMAMQQATKHNMPLAIANAMSRDDWRYVVTSYRVLTFWYLPDALFADLGLLPVELPDYNSAEYAVGLKTTAPEVTKLYNFAARGLRSVAPDVVALVERMTIDPGSIMNMLKGLAHEESASPESYYNVSCNWLRQSEALWDSWIPSKTDCIEGQGLTDMEGNFLLSPLGASGCDFCPPGSRSQRWNGTAQRVCETCSPGTFQNQPGKSECKFCESGKYTTEDGMVVCEDCPVGTFAAGIGNEGCSPCPHGPSETTNIRGAVSQWDCLCEDEYYRDAGHSESSGEYSACLPCPAGMACEMGNREPQLLEGFWAEKASSIDRAYSIYRCRDGYECPGGAAGSCADGREGIGCANCKPDHHSAEDGKCDSCDNFSILSLIMYALVGLLGLLVIAAFAQVDTARITTNCVTLGITISHLIVTLQTLSVFGGLAVMWIEPYRTLLRWFKIISFDLDMLKLSCLMADRNMEAKYVARLLVFPVCVAVLCLIFLVMKTFLRRKVLFNQAFNAVGVLIMILFLVLTITGLEPFHCITSPNGYSTLASNPSVICYQGDWIMLASFGALAILVYGVAFLAAVIQVTLRYPYMIVSTQGGVAMNKYRFMFQRFTVESYFFTPVYLVRGLFIALVPIIFADDSHRQVFALTLVLLCFGSVFAWWLPWRGSLPNITDVVVNACFIVLLVCASLLLDVKADTVLVDMQVFLCIPLVAAMVTPLGVVGFYLLRAWRSPQKYSAFLCHHKVGCAAGARLMQMDLELYLGGPVFLDSDNLENLEGLLDIVRSRVKNMVVLLTAKTLSRPWCAGEITTAFLNQVPLVPVALDGYTDPKEADLSEDAIMAQWSNAADCFSPCAIQGLTASSVKAAYVHLCAIPKIQCPRLVDDAHTEAMWRVVACCKQASSRDSVAGSRLELLGDSVSASQSRKSSTYIHLAIVANGADPEAVSGALVLSRLFRKQVQWNVEELLSPEPVEEMTRPERLLVLLTEGCLTAQYFARTLVAASSRWGAGTRTLTTAVNNFEHPSLQNLHRFIIPQTASMLNLREEEVATVFECLMDIIAVSFTPSGRLSVLETEIRNMVSRFEPCHPEELRRRGSLLSDTSRGRRCIDAQSAINCDEQTTADEASRRDQLQEQNEDQVPRGHSLPRIGLEHAGTPPKSGHPAFTNSVCDCV